MVVGRLGRRGVALAAVLAALIALVALAVGVLEGRGGGQSSPEEATGTTLACPREAPYEEGGPTVPPDSTVDPGHLVPAGSPVRVLVCRYASDDVTGDRPLTLVGSRDLSGDLDRVVTALREVPRPQGRTAASCARRSPLTPYLLGVDDGDSVAWVAAEYTPHCDYGNAYSTNGAEIFERIGEQLHDAYADGRWPNG